MRVLVVHRYYYPEPVPCASIMSAIASRLDQDGHDVDVLSGKISRAGFQSGINQIQIGPLNGVRVTRLNLPFEVNRPFWRIFNAIYIGLMVMFKSIFTRYDVIISTSIPPVLGGFFSSLAAKIARANFIYYCMDLHPEIGRLSGDFASPLVYRLLLRIDDWNCRQAKSVLVHSRDMRNTLRARPRGSEYSIELFNNFALPAEPYFSTNPKWHPNLYENQLTLIYAGNLGRFQGLETLIEAMGRIAHRKEIQLIMMGDGVTKQRLTALQKENNANVCFYDYQPVEMAREAIKSADVGIVMLAPDMYKYAYPSKTMAYLEQGCPIIAVIEEESELAKTMLEENYGFSVSIGNSEALAKLLLQLVDDPSWKQSMRQAASLAFEKYFSSSVVLDKWSKLVGQSCRTP